MIIKAAQECRGNGPTGDRGSEDRGEDSSIW
jgi:hypothetical protein